MANALKLSEIAAELARRALQSSKQDLAKRPGMGGRAAAARNARAEMKSKKVQSVGEDQTPLYPGEEGYAERTYKEQARGPVNVDTLNRQVEAPRISEAERADENSIINSMMNKTSKLSGKPQVVGGGLVKDPRVAEQLGKLSMIEQLIKRHKAGNAPSSDKMAKFNPATAKDSSNAPRMPDTLPKSQQTKNTEAMLMHLWRQEKSTYDDLLREVMDEGVR